jgi:predicted small lipoprotein YifL
MKFSIFYSLALCVLLSACGMKGPLVLPETEPASEPTPATTEAPTENQEKPAKPAQ